MINWLLTTFFTFILLFCSVARYIAAWILRACLNACFCLSWSNALRAKINRIYKREFSSVSKETSPILDSCSSTSNIPTRRGKNLCQFVQKMGEGKKKKILRVVNRYALTRHAKFYKDFWKQLCFSTIYPTGALSQLIWGFLQL